MLCILDPSHRPQRAEVGTPHIWQRRRPCRTRTTPGDQPAGRDEKSRKIAHENLKK